jgi:hypothetical protein
MSLSLYDVSVGRYLQTVTAVTGYLEKGHAHFTANGVDPNEIVDARIFPDMYPLHFQMHSVAHHSLGAIEGAKKGVFGPPSALAQLDYRGLQKLIADTLDALQKIQPAEVNALEGREVVFQMRDRRMPFTVEGFILSFSLPNFYFHATTGYDILRMKGVPVGKRDFLGHLALKTAAA